MKKLPFMTAFPLFIALAPLFAGDDSPSELTATQNVTKSLEVSPIRVSSQNVDVFFSPSDAYVPAMVQEILKAKDSVLVLTAELNLAKIAGALASVKGNNVDVRVMLDQNRLESGGVKTRRYLKQHDVKMFFDNIKPVDTSAIVIDSNVVLSGTCALTEEGTAQAGTLTVIRNNPPVVSSYLDSWNSHANHGRTVVAEARQDGNHSRRRLAKRAQIAVR